MVSRQVGVVNSGFAACPCSHAESPGRGPQRPACAPIKYFVHPDDTEPPFTKWSSPATRSHGHRTPPGASWGWLQMTTLKRAFQQLSVLLF